MAVVVWLWQRNRSLVAGIALGLADTRARLGPFRS